MCDDTPADVHETVSCTFCAARFGPDNRGVHIESPVCGAYSINYYHVPGYKLGKIRRECKSVTKKCAYLSI